MVLSKATPAGVDQQLYIDLADENGNTQHLAFVLMAVPIPSQYSAGPKLVKQGETVTLSADFVDGLGNSTAAGITQIVAVVKGVNGTTNTYNVVLTNAVTPSSRFEAPWVVPEESDWTMEIRVLEAKGATGVYGVVATSGFSSAPYDGKAGVLLFNDNSYTNDLYGRTIQNGIVAYGRTCFLWNNFYRGKLTAGVLSSQASSNLFYYSPGYDYMSTIPYASIRNDAEMRDALAGFMDGGGRVCLVGDRTAYAMQVLGDASTAAFMSNRFGSVWVQQFTSYVGGTFTGILGFDGDLLSSGRRFYLADVSYNRDEIAAVGNGIACYRYDPASSFYGATFGAGGTAGIHMNGTWRSVFLPWDIVDLDEASLNRVISDVMGYLEFGMALTIDSDNDGMSNGDELRSGTDPSNSNSVLRVNGVAQTPGAQHVIYWQCVTGKTYNVEQCTNLVSGQWTVLNPVPGNSSGTCSYTNPAPTSGAVFYRIRAM
jgi:hypothetical protein